MKKFFGILVILVPLTILLFKSTSLGLLLPQNDATLVIDTITTPLVLYVDNRLVGTLPLEAVALTAGFHTLSLYSVEGESSVFGWHEEIYVTEGDQLKVIFQTDSEGHINGVALLRFFSRDQGSVSRIFVEPQLAEVIVNDSSYKDTPVVLSAASINNLSLIVKNEGFTDLSLGVELPTHTEFEIHTQRFFDYVGSIKKVSGLTIPPGETSHLKIQRRWEWGDNVLPVPAEKLVSSDWQSLDVYQLEVPVLESTDELVRRLETLFVQQVHLFRLPFAFIVDEIGDVYEGLGLWDYDYAGLATKQLTFQSSKAPVLLLGDEITLQQKQRLEQLLSLVTSPPGASFSIIKKPSEITLDTEEVATFELVLHNNGWTTWSNTGGDQVRLRTKETQIRSDLFDSNNWLSATDAALLSDPVVIPGAETKITVPVKGATYPISTQSEFTLTQNQIEMTGPGITFSLAINGQGKGVQIKDTPTGFLNVRQTASLFGTLVATVYPGEKYLLLESQNDWHKIRMNDGLEGWVNGDYLLPL